MTINSATDEEDIPVLIHFLSAISFVTGVGYHTSGGSASYGDEIFLTEELRSLNTNRVGFCFFDLIDDEAGQVAKWGKVVFRRGPWPAGKSRLLPGSSEWNEAREAARIEAHRIENEAARKAALAKVTQEWGPAPVTSRIFGSVVR